MIQILRIMAARQNVERTRRRMATSAPSLLDVDAGHVATKFGSAHAVSTRAFNGQGWDSRSNDQAKR